MFFDLHEKYFKRNLQLLPTPYTEADNSKLLLLFFSLSALDLMSKLDLDKNCYIEWIYSLQTKGGFKGSSMNGNDRISNQLDLPHLTMTYAALCSLLILGDNLDRVDVGSITQQLSFLQKKNGSFMAVLNGESDMRFVYCACAISSILNDWSGINIDSTVEFIQKCQKYDYGFSQEPNQESHGGSTYCALASLSLMDRLNIVNRKQVARWCLNLQSNGFSGRTGKENDSCYSFWIGASLKILGYLDYADFPKNNAFVSSCQFAKGGGISKDPESYPDLMHSFFGIASTSLFGCTALKRLDPLLAIAAKSK